MFVGAVGIEVEQPARGDEMFGDHDRVLFVEGTQLSEDLFVELAAGDAFGDLGFLDARAAGALLACVFAGIGLARRTAVVVIAAVSSAAPAVVITTVALVATATVIITTIPLVATATVIITTVTVVTAPTVIVIATIALVPASAIVITTVPLVPATTIVITTVTVETAPTVIIVATIALVPASAIVVTTVSLVPTATIVITAVALIPTTAVISAIGMAWPAAVPVVRSAVAIVVAICAATAFCAAVVLAVSRIPLGHDSPYEVFSMFRSILVHSPPSRPVCGDTSDSAASSPLTRRLPGHRVSPLLESRRIQSNGQHKSNRFGGSGSPRRLGTRG
ncbi:hypothetical protein [Brevibacterium sp. S111]|uniref:hypothetical protein n=1 Tax=Brevibacterium sp. S111 TaxID=2483795 RepID=UPI0010805A82|nr:hypothetical protein [Brevibacterium sp. S111]TGD09110.1 hypothetical protein EB836_15800 [Brevibacterium sp. S111]